MTDVGGSIAPSEERWGRPRNFSERNVCKMAMRYNPRCLRQYAAFSCGTAIDGSNELIAIVDDYGDRKVVREVGDMGDVVNVPFCYELTGAVVADALRINRCRILIQPIVWGRLSWFFETSAGRAFRMPDVAQRHNGRLRARRPPRQPHDACGDPCGRNRVET